ncbi:membrane protein [Streptomyces phage Forrest]|nr:membrane protein [Streptomyces phage Forrest]QZE11497.1 membrane protein [Streptomyces phage Jada]
MFLGILGALLVTWFLAGFFLAGIWAGMASSMWYDRLIGWLVSAGCFGLWYWIVGTHINWGGLIK